MTITASKLSPPGGLFHSRLSGHRSAGGAGPARPILGQPLPLMRPTVAAHAARGVCSVGPVTEIPPPRSRQGSGQGRRPFLVRPREPSHLV
jgi:hypothetical protein